MPLVPDGWTTTLLHGLGLVEHELLLFAAFWLALGAVDEGVVDTIWLGLTLSGRGRSRNLPRRAPLALPPPLKGRIAVLVPAWREDAVIGAMLRHCLAAWPQADLRVYAGCYRNDPATLAAMIAAARESGGDPRLRIVVVPEDGPTTKAHCLNRLYAALQDDERRGGWRARGVMLHDAEDMVHPEALGALDAALDTADFAQVPVRPEPQVQSRWVAGHYADEFADAHARLMVVRDWLGAGLPSAGVGSLFARDAIERLAVLRGNGQPFAAECLTEDYECGLLLGSLGARARFLRLRDADGALVATRAFFPTGLDAAVRQKTRWLHGIAFQGWDRLGWHGSAAELWMRLRDRRGPLVAIVLLASYLALPLWAVLAGARAAGLAPWQPVEPLLALLLQFNLAALVWRMGLRGLFTGREYGWREGVRGVLRAPVSNLIAVISARRATVAYLASLRGGRVCWDKTAHVRHPAQPAELAFSTR